MRPVSHNPRIYQSKSSHSPTVLNLKEATLVVRHFTAVYTYEMSPSDFTKIREYRIFIFYLLSFSGFMVEAKLEYLPFSMLDFYFYTTFAEVTPTAVIRVHLTFRTKKINPTLSEDIYICTS